MSRKMSITEALVELKTLDSRINKASNKDWVGVIKRKDVNDPKIKEASKNIKANYQSVTDLISERSKIKSAIVKSNAVTEVTIGDEKMTVAEAIERKSSIEYEKTLKYMMERQLVNCISEVTNENRKVQTRFDSILEKLVGSDRSNVSDEHALVAETFRQNNEVELLDPLDIEKIVRDLDDRISDFEANIDIALSMSNATTFIEI